MSTDKWAIMPVLNAVDYTLQAVADLLAQTVPVRVLIIDQGSSKASNDQLRELAERQHPKVLLWSYNPPLPSLSAAWNRGLDFCWELGATEALVVNNDVRLHPGTYEGLDGVMGHTPALFVSAVGVTELQFKPGLPMDDRWLTAPDADGWGHPNAPGGPDFSCFLLSKKGHDKYRFDEGFIPAYGEDIDMHRRYMLNGDGDKIFSINLPFLHFASRTINVMSPDERAAWEKRRQVSLDYLKKKWGGSANLETFRTPFGSPAMEAKYASTNPELPVTTPDLQRWWRERGVESQPLEEAPIQYVMRPADDPDLSALIDDDIPF